jgi:hypothetical protein
MVYKRALTAKPSRPAYRNTVVSEYRRQQKEAESRLIPIVVYVAAFQEPANSSKAKPFKEKLERLPPGLYAYNHKPCIYIAASL